MRVTYTFNQYDLLTVDYLRALPNDELVQTYVIAGTYGIDYFVIPEPARRRWVAVAARARREILRRMQHDAV